jgi:threonine/homoserine/homoserine lactone efflux protein
VPDAPTLVLFAAAALTLLVIPGPSVLFIVARSIEQGRLAGFISVLGIQLGALAHVLFATFGLSELLLQSALMFSAVKYAGAAYLIYLGVRTLLTRVEATSEVQVAPAPLPRVFVQGFIVNLLNPKTALFFFAFLPQFVQPERGSVAPQVAVLGLLFIALATLSDSVYAFMAGGAGRLLKGNVRFARTQRAVAGSIYIALGVGTALSGDARK